MIPASTTILTNELTFEDGNPDLREFCGKHLAACQAHGNTKCPLCYQQGTRDSIISHLLLYRQKPSSFLKYKYAADGRNLLIN